MTPCLARFPASLDPDDPRQWGRLFTRARLRKGWSYTRVACESRLTERTVITACTTGRCNSASALKLAVALGILVALPDPPPILTAQEAQHGR